MGKMFLPEQHHHSVCVRVCVCVCVHVRMHVCDRYRDRARMRGRERLRKGGWVREKKREGEKLVPEKQNIHCYRKEIGKPYEQTGSLQSLMQNSCSHHSDDSPFTTHFHKQDSISSSLQTCGVAMIVPNL